MPKCSSPRAAYRSPYTRRDRPTKSETIEADTKFRGEDLSQELAAIIGETYDPERRVDTNLDELWTK